MSLEQKEHSFIKVSTSPVTGIEPNSSLINNPDQAYLLPLAQNLDLPVITDDSQYGVFIWHSPLDHPIYEEYPEELRSFTPVPVLADSQSLARRMIANYGPFIPHQKNQYADGKLTQLLAREQSVYSFEVPDHQAR